MTHAVLLTADLDRLSRFYRDVGGLEEVHRADGAVFLRGSLSRYPFHLVLCRKDAPDDQRYHHVSFELESEEALLEAESALRSRGVEPEHVVDSELKRSFFLKDPDGFLSEYYVQRAPGFAKDARPLYV